MLKKLVCIVFLVCSYHSYANENNYIAYFLTVNKAESCIAEANYQEALNLYEELFHSYSHCFYKDLHNAALCAMEVNCLEEAFKFSKDLILHGYTLSDFDSAAFDFLRKGPEGWEKFTQEYSLCRTQYESGLNPVQREKYMDLFLVDQQISSPENKNDIRLQDSVFYCLSQSLFELVKEYGFPQWAINKDTFGVKFYLMLRHYCGLVNRIQANSALQADDLYKKIKKTIPELVRQALNEGWILPDMYVDITTYWDSSNPYGKMQIKIDFEHEQISLMPMAPQVKLDEINKRRESIGLYSIKEISANVLNTTWLKYYPFNEVKEACAKCDSCTANQDYLRIIASITHRFQKQYTNKTYFILPDYSDARDYYYSSLSLFKNKKSGHDSNNQ